MEAALEIGGWGKEVGKGAGHAGAKNWASSGAYSDWEELEGEEVELGDQDS